MSEIAAAPGGTVVSPPSGAEILARAEVAKAEQQQALQNMEIIPARRSESIAKLAHALSKAQGKITAAKRTSANPFFKSKYADLASIWDACRQALSEEELAVIQPATSRGRIAIITTILVHSSGEFIEEPLLMMAESDRPQAIGSTISYGRRYGLASMVGVATEDDDAQAAENQLPKGTKWDKGTSPMQQERIAGSSDDLPEMPAPAEKAERISPAAPTGNSGSPAGSAIPTVGTPLAPARPPNALGTPAPAPVLAGNVPPPPGRPPMRAPGVPPVKSTT